MAKKPAGRYSGGMQKEVRPCVLSDSQAQNAFLDEPTTGLDTQSRAAIWEYLEGLNKKEGITIFLTTQYLEEADRLCRELSIYRSREADCEWHSFRPKGGGGRRHGSL